MSAGRERIVEKAFQLFLTRGFERTSMAEIVSATGLSKGAVYHHFASKDELLDAAIDTIEGAALVAMMGGDDVPTAIVRAADSLVAILGLSSDSPRSAGGGA